MKVNKKSENQTETDLIQDMKKRNSVFEKIKKHTVIFQNEQKNASDRETVLITECYLNYYLQLLLETSLVEVENKKDKLFKENPKILESFSSKIEISYRFGLISKSEYDLLKNVRRIRNKFAHALDTNSFELKDIKLICKKMKIDKTQVTPQDDEDLTVQIATTSREIFVESTKYLFQCLSARLYNNSPTVRKSPNNFENAWSFLEVHLEYSKSFTKSFKSNNKDIKSEEDLKYFQKWDEELQINIKKIKDIHDNKRYSQSFLTSD